MYHQTIQAWIARDGLTNLAEVAQIGRAHV